MEFVLRCNDLKCRAQLHDRAVVTTCSHVFCTQCADITGLSRSHNAHRTCPACGAELHNPDDVVVAGLNPSEDYKTSVLSGLSPTIIMECASRSLAFHSYQTSQEIIYQEHLAKGLTEKYNVLSQQMDQLIHDANSQIKVLQDKVQAQQAECEALEAKNNELSNAFMDKARALARQKKMYDSLKGQVMASQVAVAAGDEAEMTLQTARGHRFIDRMPSARTGTGAYSQPGGAIQQPGGTRLQHKRQGSGSSGSSRQHRGGIGIGPAPNYAQHLHGRGLSGRVHTGQSAPVGTPRQSRLPVLRSTRQAPALNVSNGPPYQPSPMTQRQTVGNNSLGRSFGNSYVGRAEASRRTWWPVAEMRSEAQGDASKEGHVRL